MFAKNYIFIPPLLFEIQKITPGTQKAVYLTGYGSMGNKKKRQQIYELINKTELNSIVFDVKDDNGFVDYNCTIPEVIKTGAVKGYYDIDEIMDEFDDMDIYSIARFVAFKDNVIPKSRPDLAILDKETGNPIILEGSTWVDIYSEEVWDYYIKIIKDLASRGVDEIQFDYIRAPSRGNLEGAEFPHNFNGFDKVWAIKNFLQKVREETKTYNIRISADVFGWVFITENDQDIGQLIEEMAPHLDYIYPMVYPSHYNIHFLGFNDAEAHPYEVVKYTLEKGLKRIGDTDCKIIPFIQAFSLDLEYTDKEILAQIRAAEELGIKGLLFWNATNKYTSLEKALISRSASSETESE
ncbi:MAG: putative glycoside hydrolase [Candidatus Humimicrobiaceae bacterium]